jgi:hypothetical protein
MRVTVTVDCWTHSIRLDFVRLFEIKIGFMINETIVHGTKQGVMGASPTRKGWFFDN